MSDKYKQPHNRYVIYKEEQDRFLKIKEYKYILQKQVAADLSVYKRNNSIYCNHDRHDPKQH